MLTRGRGDGETRSETQHEMSINHLPTALRHNEGSARLLRIASNVATVVSAVGSVALLLYMGRRNKSIVLMVLFSIWVLAPFVESLLLNALITKRGSAVAQTALHVAMLILAVLLWHCMRTLY